MTTVTVGYGTFPLGEELVRTIPQVVDCGYRLVDTSDNYKNEKFVGRGLAACGISRDRVTVVTKFSRPLKTYRLEECFNQSERNLGGRIDMYLLHWPYPFLWKVQWRKLEELYLSGRCKEIGVCNFDRPRLEKLLRFCRVKPAVCQFERHPMFQQNETAEFCRENGIKVMCYSPFARMNSRLMKNAVIGRIAESHSMTPGQVILRWSVERGDIPIPASSSEGHIRENFDIEGFSLSDGEMREIDALDAGMRVRFNPDNRFSLEKKIKFLILRVKGFFHVV